MLERFFALCLIYVCVCSGAQTDKGYADERYNVLFIAADDLRCDLSSYGHRSVKTPNLDRLAERSVQFNRAYCQQALCNPSRSSLLTGLRPDTLQQWNLSKHFRDQIPDVVTLPQHFKRNGYFTQGVGKIFHNWVTEIHGDPVSWSVPAEMHYATHSSDKPMVRGEMPPNLAKDPKCECRDVPDDAYFDGRIASRAIEVLGQRKSEAEPFFLAVGFWKPHSPFNAPKKYWDMYDRDSIPEVTNATWPKNAPKIAWHNSQELLGRKNARKLSPEAVAEIRHGYLAAITYMDAQIGRVLDELQRLELADSTIVVFWSDHGYHLGEQTLWAKTSNFELDARVPMLIATPDPLGHANGQASDSVVELLDLYPTLVELCNLPLVGETEGKSLVPVLKDPAVQVKAAALTQHPRPSYYGDQMQAMGYSIRTPRFRYTQWHDRSNGGIIASELYDHGSDDDEMFNRVDDPKFERDVAKLKSVMSSMVTDGIGQN